MKRSLTLFVLTAVVALTVHAQPASETASYYHEGYHGSTTASGETYDHNALTAAHRSLPFNSMVKVTRLDNGRAVVVRINDRMAMGPGHTIDLSGAAARRLDIIQAGIADVRVEVLDTGTDRYGSVASVENSSKPRIIGWSAPVTTSAIPTTVVNSRVISPDGPPAPSVKTRVEAPKPNSQELIYTLQIGSFSTREGARQMAKAHDSAWIAEVVVNGVETWRVYFSQFSSEEPARLAQKALWKDGQDSFLRRVMS